MNKPETRNSVIMYGAKLGILCSITGSIIFGLINVICYCINTNSPILIEELLLDTGVISIGGMAISILPGMFSGMILAIFLGWDFAKKKLRRWQILFLGGLIGSPIGAGLNEIFYVVIRYRGDYNVYIQRSISASIISTLAGIVVTFILVKATHDEPFDSSG